MSTSEFAKLPLKPELVEGVSQLGYLTMTPIQAQSLPLILAGDDVIAQGKTGSGKTAAFGLGLLNSLQVERYCVQSLVLCPTRELADQVAKELRRLARCIPNVKVLTLCGGKPFGPQLASLEHGAHCVVGTPGRIEEHVRKGKLALDDVSTLVLDEADRMLAMGFQETLDAIVEHMPAKRQTLMFSATFPDDIQTLSRRLMRTPTSVQADTEHSTSSIEESFYLVDNPRRADAVARLLKFNQPESCMVFCNTKVETQQLWQSLYDQGFSALALHGDMEQGDRDQVLLRFANKSASVLVATDVAARGIDIDTLELVINYNIAKDLEVHTHRVGRTGRAGQQGKALTLVSDNERYKFSSLGHYLQRELSFEELPPKRGGDQQVYRAEYITIQIGAGKKQKLRAGDILGALTGEEGIAGSDVGKITIHDFSAYVAVRRDVVKAALAKLSNDKIKGRTFRVRSL